MTRAHYSVLTNFLARRAEQAAERNAAASIGRTSTPATTSRRVITRDEAMHLSDFVREVLDERYKSVQITHFATAVAMHRHGVPPRCVDVDTLKIGWPTYMGHNKIQEFTVDTNVGDPETLRRVIADAIVKVTLPPLSQIDAEEEAEWEKLYQPKPYTYPEVHLWNDATVSGADTQRGIMMARLFAPLKGTSLVGAGSVAMGQRIFFNRRVDTGTVTWGEAVDSEISITARSADGAVAGWGGQASRDWTQLQPEQIAQAAIVRAEQQRGAERVEPGRYTAILSATAVGQLLRALAPLFRFGPASPFDNYNASGMHQPRDKRGQRLMDPRITLSTDPTDPLNGDFPFFEDDFGVSYPSGAVTWIDHGVLKRRSISFRDGLKLGMTPLKDPNCMRMSGDTTTIEEMIAQCERGIYVNRFSNIEVIDDRSGAMSGFTRDGCLLIMNGKIKKPVKDFRFYESPVLAFNRVVALGRPERTAFGFTVTRSQQWWRQQNNWPYPPVVAPPLMIRDFNFSALADAV